MAGVVFSKLSGKNDSLYKAVEGVITEIIMDADNKETKDDQILNAIFNVRSSKKFGERGGTMTEFGNFEIVKEGGVAIKDEMEEGYAKLIVHDAFSKSFTITHEMAADDNIEDAKVAAKAFMRAYKRSKLDYATRFLTAEGTTFTYGNETKDRTTGDKKALFATDHPGKRSGVATQSNVFTNELGTNATMLYTLANIGMNFKNDSGVVGGYTFDTIMLPGNRPAMIDLCERIIHSSNVVGSDYNDINTQQNKWKLVVNHAWQITDDTHNPYIIMSSEANEDLRGINFFNREALDIQNEIKLNTRNQEWNGYCRFGVGAFNWRSVIMGGAKSGTTLT